MTQSRLLLVFIGLVVIVQSLLNVNVQAATTTKTTRRPAKTVPTRSTPKDRYFGRPTFGSSSQLQSHTNQQGNYIYKPTLSGTELQNFQMPSWMTNNIPMPNFDTKQPGAAAPAPSPSPAPTDPLSKQCGLNRYSGTTRDQALASPFGRIINGQEADRNEFPWQVRIMAKAGGQSALCGGTLINELSVLTAAHCIYRLDARAVTVILGDHDRTNNNEDGEKTIRARAVKWHENYDPNSNDYDYALITLANAVTFSNQVRPACLPPSSGSDYTLNNAVISGWGRQSEAGPLGLPDKLQKAATRVMSQNKCRQIYARNHLDITPNMICAEPSGTDTCQGDSGGPMAAKVNGKYTVIGVTSFGIGCGRQYPGVYSRVSAVLPWIKQNAGNFGTV